MHMNTVDLCPQMLHWEDLPVDEVPAQINDYLLRVDALTNTRIDEIASANYRPDVKFAVVREDNTYRVIFYGKEDLFIQMAEAEGASDKNVNLAELEERVFGGGILRFNLDFRNKKRADTYFLTEFYYAGSYEEADFFSEAIVAGLDENLLKKDEDGNVVVKISFDKKFTR